MRWPSAVAWSSPNDVMGTPRAGELTEFEARSGTHTPGHRQLLGLPTPLRRHNKIREQAPSALRFRGASDHIVDGIARLQPA
jgi:hypothetical protein